MNSLFKKGVAAESQAGRSEIVYERGRCRQILWVMSLLPSPLAGEGLGVRGRRVPNRSSKTPPPARKAGPPFPASKRREDPADLNTPSLLKTKKLEFKFELKIG